VRSLPENGHVIRRILDAAYADDKRAKAATAREAMTSPAVTIGPEEPIARAARLMLEHMINRLPVVSEGRLVGILARSDLVRAFRRSDEEVEREIRTDVLRALWIDPGRVSITVTDGDVVVAGEVENHSTATALEKWIGCIPGVTGVRSELRWQIDDRSHKVAAAADRLTRKL
jgi:CBS domain-containing protein